MSADHQIQSLIQKATGASRIGSPGIVQQLWSGYGSICRYTLRGAERPSVILKRIRLHESGDHPRGWNSDRSHQRKLKSYEVESHWYRSWSSMCNDECRVPHILAVCDAGEETYILLEDLDASGFSGRPRNIDDKGLFACIHWLANFHATFLHNKPEGLWKTGTYWHLDTRPDELEILDDHGLKAVASEIDRLLSDCPYQTFVHGDAKLANFCFSTDRTRVAAVDFQYVGGGCGMKDLVYFLGSCLSECECEIRESELLDYYFLEFQNALELKTKAVSGAAVEASWRPLYPVAWTDFHRFLKGWSPGHWKINDYSERLKNDVIRQLSVKDET